MELQEMQEKRNNLINQREGLKEHYIKTCGAIELLETMIKDKETDAKKDTVKKSK
tara:strand:+ start:287 stop:451 length:165 start_codon:yes stop_codon:yes gene_type:complete